MDFGSLRTLFLEALNRNDCTNEQADRFIEMGLRRTERLLRTPLQKAVISYTIDNTYTGELPVPTDYLGIHLITVNGDVLPRISRTQKSDFSGWYIEDADFVMNSDISEGDIVKIIYFNEWAFPPVADGDITEYTLVLPDVIIYAALVFACSRFIDVRKQEFQNDLSALVQEVQMMADMDEFGGTGMQVTPQGGGIA